MKQDLGALDSKSTDATENSGSSNETGENINLQNIPPTLVHKDHSALTFLK